MMHFNAKTVLAVSLVLLAGCSSLNPFSSKSTRNEPAALVSFKPSMKLSTVWSSSVGKSGTYVFSPALADGKVFAASADGDIMAIDVKSGKTLWRINAGMGLTAGVGSDGNTVVVAGTDGVVLAFDAMNGKKRWKARASSEVLSAPAVGMGMVVLRSLDNRIVAFDAESGTQRWFLQRTTPALTLRAAPGIIITEGNAYVALPGGRVLALALASGIVRWESIIAEPRGATELERIVDVSGAPVITGRDMCAVTFQGRVACGDAVSGKLRWARELSSEAGVGVDERFVFAADERGNVNAFARDNGASIWRNTSLGWRRLAAPVSFGRAVIVGDAQGYLHFLSREEGAMLARVSTDGSAIKTAPIVAGSNLIVQTEAGKLLALTAD